MIKRSFDFLFSTLGLLLLAPILLLLAILIKVDSPGPVFFRQLRVGRGCKLFRIHKFRTMINNAELLGPQITVGADERITCFGKFLRKYKLDELPQLIDVWIGDMSLVGPRPEVPYYVQHYPDHLRELILSMRPGITDLASIEFRDENEVLGNAVDPHLAYINEVLPAKLNYYKDYASSYSLMLDIKIIFATIKALIR